MDFLTFIKIIFFMGKNILRKNDGFEGQRAIIIPKKVLAESCVKNPLISDLYITDIGYYPKARFHYRRRIKGADEHIFIYCVEGRGSITLNKQNYNIEAGEFFVVPKKVRHFYGAKETNPWTIYWVHFAGSKADAFTKYLKENLNSFKKSIDYSEKRIEIFDSIYERFERGYSIENMICANLCFSHFLSSLLQPERSFNQNGKQEEDIINKVIDFMKKNIDAMCTLAEMAHEINISASHLSSIFKHRTGYPPMEYFNHLKVQKACQYLMFTELRINEIAAKIGIDDPYYFSRFFKRRIGVSPHEYRAKRKKIEKKE
jgi:AraC-like DNA-binding protein/mannose-6-phosphate isomerase-like protein (cupin superfamily)